MEQRIGLIFAAEALQVDRRDRGGVESSILSRSTMTSLSTESKKRWISHCHSFPAQEKWQHYSRMSIGSIRSSAPDLFSCPSPSASANSSPSSPVITRTSSRHILPADLPNAIKQLDDQELDQLLSAALGEHKRRAKKPPISDEGSGKRRVDMVAVPLTQGKLNAIRAAFKAGVTPSRIARQFGISQSDVRKALAANNAKQ